MAFCRGKIFTFGERATLVFLVLNISFVNATFGQYFTGSLSLRVTADAI